MNVLWPSPLEVDFGVFCQRAEGQLLCLWEWVGRAHRDVRLERNQGLNSKMGEQFLPKRERAAVCGERSGAWGCVAAHAACALLAGSMGFCSS